MNHIIDIRTARWSPEFMPYYDIIHLKQDFLVFNNLVAQLQKGDKLIIKYYGDKFDVSEKSNILLQSEFEITKVVMHEKLEQGYVILIFKCLISNKII